MNSINRILILRLISIKFDEFGNRIFRLVTSGVFVTFASFGGAAFMLDLDFLETSDFSKYSKF